MKSGGVRRRRQKQLTLFPLTPIEQVLELFRKYNHYSLKELKTTMWLKLQEDEISEQIIDNALKIYQEKCFTDHKAPHPNYFIKICNTLQREMTKQEELDFTTPFGRMI